MPRILVVGPNWIGDALMARPLLARLREQRPGTELDMLAPEWVAPVARRMPEVDEVITAPFRHGALQLARRLRLGSALKKRGYTEAIVLPNSWKAALVPFFSSTKPLSVGQKIVSGPKGWVRSTMAPFGSTPDAAASTSERIAAIETML